MNSEYVFHGFILMLFVIWFAVIKKTKSSSKNVYLIFETICLTIYSLYLLITGFGWYLCFYSTLNCFVWRELR